MPDVHRRTAATAGCRASAARVLLPAPSGQLRLGTQRRLASGRKRDHARTSFYYGAQPANHRSSGTRGHALVPESSGHAGIESRVRDAVVSAAEYAGPVCPSPYTPRRAKGRGRARHCRNPLPGCAVSTQHTRGGDRICGLQTPLVAQDRLYVAALFAALCWAASQPSRVGQAPRGPVAGGHRGRRLRRRPALLAGTRCSRERVARGVTPAMPRAAGGGSTGAGSRRSVARFGGSAGAFRSTAADVNRPAARNGRSAVGHRGRSSGHDRGGCVSPAAPARINAAPYSSPQDQRKSNGQAPNPSRANQTAKPLKRRPIA